MNCLVTGGAGFIGSHLVRMLLHNEYDVRVLDNFSTGKKENIEAMPIELLEGDIRDPVALERAMKGVDYVFHLAALASVGRSIKDPLTTHVVNTNGTLNVLEAAHRAGVKRVVYAASSSAYGNVPTLPKVESGKPEPASPYAVSKLTGEYYCQVYLQTFGLETACVRYFNVFGPRQDPKSEYAAVIPRFIDNALKGVSPVIYGDGLQSRDFTYVDNAVQATILAAFVPAAAGKVFNVACGERRNLLELIDMLEDLLADQIEPVFEEPRAGDVKHSQADIELAKSILGYYPETTFKQGLKETVEWFRGVHALQMRSEPESRIPASQVAI